VFIIDASFLKQSSGRTHAPGPLFGAAAGGRWSPRMISLLNACHLAPNSYLIGGVTARVRNCGQHQIKYQASGYSRPNSTTAAAARPTRPGGQWDPTNGLGALLNSNQLPQAVELLETCLDSSQRVHGVKAGELLEGEQLGLRGSLQCVVFMHTTAVCL
jgi:hypothetical protein